MNQRLSHRFRCPPHGGAAMESAVIVVSVLAALVTMMLPMSGLARAIFGAAG